MADGASLGDAFVRIRPDTSEFKDELDAELQGSDNDLDIKITANDDEAKVTLDDVQARIDRLKSEAASAKVEIDDTDARRKIADIQLALDALGNESLNPKIDDSGIQQISSDLDDLDAKLDDTGSRFDSLSQKASDASGSGGIGGLIGAATLLAPALVEVGAVGIGAFVGLGAAASVAGLGVAAFALAAGPELKGIEGQAKAMLAAFQGQEASTVLPALQGALALLPPILNGIKPLVAGASAAFLQLEGSAKTALTGPFYTQFANFLGQQAGPAIHSFGTLVGGLGTAFAGLDRAFAPVITQIEGGLTHLGSSLSTFGESTGTDTGLNAFVSYIEQEGPQVVHTIEDLASAAIAVGRDAAQVGPSFLTIIDAMAKIVGAVANADPALVEIGAALLTLKKVSDAVPFSISGVGSALRTLSAFSGVTTGASSAGLALDGLGAKAILGASSIGLLGTAAVGLVDPVGLGAAALLGLSGTLDKFNDAGAKPASQFVSAFIQGLQGIADPVAKAQQELGKLQVQQYLLNGAVAAHATAQGEDNGSYQKAAAQYGQVTDQIADLKKAIPGLTQAQQGAAAAALLLASAQGTVGTSASASATFLQALATGFASAATAANALDTGVSSLQSQLTTLAGNTLSAQAATLSARTAIQNLGSTMSSSGDAAARLTLLTTGSSMAATIAQTSANSFASALFNQYIPAYAKAGDSTTTLTGLTNGAIAAFDKAELGANATAAQVNALNAQYQLTPKNVSTAIALVGADNVIAQANQAHSALSAAAQNYVASLHLAVEIQEETSGAIGGGHPVGRATGLGGGMGAHWAMVGERGPEIMAIPANAVIWPHGKSPMDTLPSSLPGYAAGLNTDITITPPTVTAGHSTHHIDNSTVNHITVNAPTASPAQTGAELVWAMKTQLF